ncbi:MAG: hypothetical protein ABIL58_02600 [Pseudomonadota bacterium]
MAMENDIVLIYFEDAPLVFARIEEILPDHKPDWYHVKLLMLQLPVQTVTWILRDAYINGDPFTMDGKKMRLEKVAAPGHPATKGNDDGDTTAAPGVQPPSKVISFTDLKKKR